MILKHLRLQEIYSIKRLEFFSHNKPKMIELERDLIIF